LPRPTRSTPFPYTTLFRSQWFGPTANGSATASATEDRLRIAGPGHPQLRQQLASAICCSPPTATPALRQTASQCTNYASCSLLRSEEHTSELQSRFDLVCR